MDTQKEYATLMEAYNAVYEKQESINEDAQKMVGQALDAAARNPVIQAIGKVIAPVGKGRGTVTKAEHEKNIKKEEVETDLFDYLLEYLVAEGYADTNKAALAIMANMSEEWKQSIVEERRPFPFKKVERQMKKARKGSVYGRNTENEPAPNVSDEEKKNTRRFSRMHQASETAKREKQEADNSRRSSTFYKDTHPASAPQMKKAR